MYIEKMYNFSWKEAPLILNQDNAWK